MSEILKPLNENFVKTIGEVFYEKGKPYQNVVVPCSRCGGSGHFSYNSMYGTTCMKCNGTKGFKKTIRLYTEKELLAISKRKEKTEEKRKIEAKKYEEERKIQNNQIWKKNLGFLEGDEIYLVALKDTFSIKDGLKEKGAKWMPMFKSWGFQNDKYEDIYPLKRVEFSETTYLNEHGIYQTNDEAIEKIINSIQNPDGIVSEFIGKIGDKIEFEVKFERSIYLGSSQYGSMYANKMTDECGNIIMWKSSSSIDREEGTMIKIKGTIKDHSEFRGEKQTIITRCKVL